MYFISYTGGEGRKQGGARVSYVDFLKERRKSTEGGAEVWHAQAGLSWTFAGDLCGPIPPLFCRESATRIHLLARHAHNQQEIKRMVRESTTNEVHPQKDITVLPVYRDP